MSFCKIGSWPKQDFLQILFFLPIFSSPYAAPDCSQRPLKYCNFSLSLSLSLSCWFTICILGSQKTESHFFSLSLSLSQSLVLRKCPQKFLKVFLRFQRFLLTKSKMIPPYKVSMFCIQCRGCGISLVTRLNLRLMF